MTTPDDLGSKAIPLPPPGSTPGFVTFYAADADGTMPLHIQLVRDAASVRCYVNGRAVVLEYPPDATGNEIQAALDAAGFGWIRVTCGPLGDPVEPTKRRRPGPPPRAESAKERGARWRRGK